MTAVLDIVVPLFGIGVLGYLAARQGWFSSHASEGLARLVFDWAVPLMLLRVFATTPLPDRFPWDLLAAFYVPAACVYGLGMLVARKAFDRTFPEQIVTGFSCAFGNSVLVGLPLVLLTFGEAASVPFFILLSVHGLGYFTITTVLLESSRNRARSIPTLVLSTAKGLLRNPLILGLASGLILNRLHIELPRPVDTITGYMQQAVLPCALFSLGAALFSYGFAGRLSQAVFVVAAKTIVFPALVWMVAVHVFALPTLSAMMATLLAATPSGVNTYLFAQRYEAAPRLATTAVFLSHVVSVLTLTALLLMFAHIGW